MLAFVVSTSLTRALTRALAPVLLASVACGGPIDGARTDTRPGAP